MRACFSALYSGRFTFTTSAPSSAATRAAYSMAHDVSWPPFSSTARPRGYDQTITGMPMRSASKRILLNCTKSSAWRGEPTYSV